VVDALAKIQTRLFSGLMWTIPLPARVDEVLGIHSLRRNKFWAVSEVLERKPRHRKWTRSATILSKLHPAPILHEAPIVDAAPLKSLRAVGGSSQSELSLRITRDSIQFDLGIHALPPYLNDHSVPRWNVHPCPENNPSKGQRALDT